MGRRYERKRTEVQDNIKENSRIKTDRGILKNEFSILSSLDSLLGELEDEAQDAVRSVEVVGEQEFSRLEDERQTNESEKSTLVGVIEEEISKLQKGIATLNEMESSMFGKHSIEQAKKKYSQQADDYVKLLNELGNNADELTNIPSEKLSTKTSESKERASAPSENSAPLIHGVSQTQINSLRGIRAHQAENSVTPNDIKIDYSRVGISITYWQARKILSSIYLFSTTKGCEKMREAGYKKATGEALTSRTQKKYLARYRLCEEYCKIAPTFSSPTTPVIFRGIHDSSKPEKHEYFEKLLSLRPGDSWDMDKMPSSFSSNYSRAKFFAGSHGIIIHTASSTLKNSTSIKGISAFSHEDEILVADYNWKISSIDDQRNNGDGFYHITLEVES